MQETRKVFFWKKSAVFELGVRSKEGGVELSGYAALSNAPLSFSFAANNASGSRMKSAKEKSGSPLPLCVILLRFKRNYAHCVRSVTAFQSFRFSRNNTQAPSANNAHVDGSGTALASTTAERTPVVGS